jgi:osmotically inducible protein OsmC
MDTLGKINGNATDKVAHNTVLNHMCIFDAKQAALICSKAHRRNERANVREVFVAKGAVMERTASAVWKGSLKDGKGVISSQSGVLKETQYSFSTRFENGVGTNPEELIAAAHAGCFTMALSAQLGNANLTPESLETSASVKFGKTDEGFTITAIHLTTRAKVPGASESAFETAAQNAKNGCPISRLFKGNTEITLDAKLV